MKTNKTCLFWLLIPGIITVLLSSTNISGFSSTPANNTVLQQAQRSLEANQKQLATVLPDPVPNVVPSAVQKVNSSLWGVIRGTCVILGAHDRVAPKEPLESKNPIQIIRKWGTYDEKDFEALKSINSCDDIKRVEQNLWLTWKDPDKMFQIDFPATWTQTARQNRFDANDMTLGIDDSSLMTLNMDYTSFTSLTEVLDSVLTTNKLPDPSSNIQVFQRHDASNYTINGHPTAMIIFTIKDPSQQQVEQQVYSIISDKLLTIQYVAPTDIFDVKLPLIGKVIQSISVSN